MNCFEAVENWQSLHSSSQYCVLQHQQKNRHGTTLGSPIRCSWHCLGLFISYKSVESWPITLLYFTMSAGCKNILIHLPIHGYRCCQHHLAIFILFKSMENWPQAIFTLPYFTMSAYVKIYRCCSTLSHLQP